MVLPQPSLCSMLNDDDSENSEADDGDGDCQSDGDRDGNDMVMATVMLTMKVLW